MNGRGEAVITVVARDHATNNRRIRIRTLIENPSKYATNSREPIAINH